jgi:hypothetical protein
MVRYNLLASDFLKTYEIDGVRDKYYKKRFGHSMPLPVNHIKDKDKKGNEVILDTISLSVIGIFRDIDNKLTAQVSDEVKDAQYSIEKACAKIRGLQEVEKQSKSKTGKYIKSLLTQDDNQ